MATAALALAAAVLLGGRASAPRLRIGRQRRPNTRLVCRDRETDPLAAASAFDIFAVCLSAGMAVPAAARATVPCAPPGLAGVLGRAADLLALGADPDTAWAPPEGTDADEHTLALLRLARRSARSGSALADGVAELAVSVRNEVDHNASAAAERAAVVIAGPLGACFLPAFVCLGVVPVVAGLATDVFSSGLL